MSTPQEMYSVFGCKRLVQSFYRQVFSHFIIFSYVFLIYVPLFDSIKVFYGSGYCLVLNIPTPDSDDIPEIVRRLEEISIGCQVKQYVCCAQMSEMGCQSLPRLLTSYRSLRECHFLLARTIVLYVISLCVWRWFYRAMGLKRNRLQLMESRYLYI